MRLASLLLLLLAGAATARHLNAANSLRPAPPTEDVEDNDPAPWRVHPRALREALVQFRPGSGPVARGRALGRGGGAEAEVVVPAAAGRGPLVRATFGAAAGKSTAKAAKRVADDPAVEFVEPNFIYTKAAESNDPYYTGGNLWGMYGDANVSPKNTFGSQAAEAWAAGYTGRPADCNAAEVFIGIIDEGFMIGHTDLAANVGRNPGEVSGNGIDDDGNGYVDDIYGWDFVSNNNGVFDGVGDDHGTHVAGTIGAVGGNGAGVAGVSWGVKMLSGKFLGNQGGTTANAIRAVQYFTALKTRASRPVNIVATSNSWGGGGFSQGLYDAIAAAGRANILFIAAAGNSAVNVDASPQYPAAYQLDNVISVASITSTGALSSFSNYGATRVHLGAPGSGIVSTVPASGRKNSVVSGYASYSGTSMATPHVSGAAALYAAYHPTATAAQIKQAILNSATPTSSLAGRCVTGGRLNVAALMGVDNLPQQP